LISEKPLIAKIINLALSFFKWEAILKGNFPEPAIIAILSNIIIFVLVDILL